jgi:LruC domain-containing protein
MKRAGERKASLSSNSKKRRGQSWLSALIAGAFALMPTSGFALDSVALTDTVKSTGIGNIDLLKDATALELEEFRQDSSSALLFAVDVNEAASGSEKASSQGVSLDTVELRAVIGGIEYLFDEFSTSTQADLARAGSTSRSPFYTLIGDTGSNRISGNSVQERFDAVITVPVDMDLSNATSIVIDIRLLETNVSLGDPEAFYDYSNGFEDVALVNPVDASYLEALDPGQDEAPAVILVDEPEPTVSSWTSYPSATGFYTAGYEDSFPNNGDYDFNDLLVAYRVEFGKDQNLDVVAMRMTAFLVARGAGHTHDWHIRFPVLAGTSGSMEIMISDPTTFETQTRVENFSGGLDIVAFEDTRSIFRAPPGYVFANTEPGSPFVRGPRFDATVTFDSPVSAASLGVAPFDPYIYVHETGYEVHLVDQAPTASSLNASQGLVETKNASGYPFALMVPVNWPVPWERTDVGRAYPNLSKYVQANGTSFLDWYDAADPAHSRNYAQQDWDWGVPPF